MTKSALLIKMIDILRAKPGITVYEMAHKLGRSERTIYRWVNQLAQDLHTPIYCDNGGYYLAESPQNKKVDLSPQELLALRLSLKSTPFGQGSPIEKHAHSAWLKIRDAVSGYQLETATEMACNFSVNVTAPSTDLDSAIVETLESAVRDHRRLKIIYRSQRSGDIKDYTIDPYALVFRRHSWYLVAFCIEHEKVIQFKLARLIRASKTNKLFDIPADFSVDEYYNLSWEVWAGGEPTRVRVRFTPKVAKMIAEVRRHKTQVVYPQPDGSVIFEAVVSGIEEIAIWIMGYGKHAQVIEPESLKEYIANHAREVLAYYVSDEDFCKR